MPQLRDVETSTLLTEGMVLELVLIADAIGRAEFLFDDVSESFDADAVRAGYESGLASLREARDASEDRETRVRLAASVTQQEQLEADALARVGEVHAALLAARG